MCWEDRSGEQPSYAWTTYSTCPRWTDTLNKYDKPSNYVWPNRRHTPALYYVCFTSFCQSHFRRWTIWISLESTMHPTKRMERAASHKYEYVCGRNPLLCPTNPSITFSLEYGNFISLQNLTSLEKARMQELLPVPGIAGCRPLPDIYPMQLHGRAPPL